MRKLRSILIGTLILCVIRFLFFLCPFQVDMSKVNVDTVKPWIAQRVTELLGIEDDVLVEFVYNQLEPRVRF